MEETMRSGKGARIGGLAAIVLALAGCVDTGVKPKSTPAVAATKTETAPASVTNDSSGTKEHGTATSEIAGGPATNEKAIADSKKTEQAANEPSADESSPKQVTTLKPPVIRPATMPEVVMSAAHAADCFVGVGDPFPDFRLPDLQGRTKTPGDMQGSAMTVVVFWTGDRLVADDQLRYLDEHVGPYADLGVRAVAIYVGRNVEDARQAVNALQLRTPVLLDRDRALFSRVGRNHFPRTYLLDRDGRILWFDIEFSRNTRESLEQAIHASLNSA
jgi:peroxiredoxin